MKKKNVYIISVCAIVLVSALAYIWHRSHLNHNIKVSGNIEATETRLSFRIAGRINELLADEGYSVKRGQVLAKLDKDELLKIKEQAQADLEKAKSDYNLREKEYSRFQVLVKTNAVSIDQKDTSQNLFEVARHQLDFAQKALELAGTRLGYADMNSSTDGFVLVKSAEAGEVVQPGSPVFTVADLNDIWLTAYINETDLGKIKLNQAVDIKTDSYPDKTYKGRISFISEEAEFTPKYIQTTEERVKLVYRVKIDVANPNSELKPGMPADGYIIE